MVVRERPMEEDGTMATILVIEEEPQLLRLWREVFEDAGYSVYAARDLAEGLTHCQQHPMDLVMAELPAAEEEDLAMLHAGKLPKAGQCGVGPVR